MWPGFAQAQPYGPDGRSPAGRASSFSTRMRSARLRPMAWATSFTSMDSGPRKGAYFFSHCWINYRDLAADDPGQFDVAAPRVDWFENSRRATLAHRAACIALAPRYKSFAPLVALRRDDDVLRRGAAA